MKYSKIAAAVAGSVIAVGVGAPAFADSGTATTPTMPTSINGGVDELLAAQPVQKVVEGTPLAAVLQTADRTTETLPSQTQAGGLVGQAVDATQGAALPTVTGAQPGSLLGGLPLGG